jgi:hypothetical protein
VWATKGRPSLDRADRIAAMVEVIAAALSKATAPTLTAIPASKSPRIRAAIAADNAERTRAYNDAKSAVAALRASVNGR